MEWKGNWRNTNREGTGSSRIINLAIKGIIAGGLMINDCFVVTVGAAAFFLRMHGIRLVFPLVLVLCLFGIVRDVGYHVLFGTFVLSFLSTSMGLFETGT